MLHLLECEQVLNVTPESSRKSNLYHLEKTFFNVTYPLIMLSFCGLANITPELKFLKVVPFQKNNNTF